MSSYHCQIKPPRQKSAIKHSDYIQCLGRFTKKKDELILEDSGNMPSWAKADPKAFWNAADGYERKKGQAYKEIEVAIPRELTEAQQIELVRTFTGGVLAKHAYTFAIHNKKASDGLMQPHAHIMFSPRLNDGIDRDRELYFKRAASPYRDRKTKQMVTPDPSKGGCKKADCWSGSLSAQAKHVEKVRQLWEKAVNQAYEKANLPHRVDCRSLADQGIDRVPQVHRGPVANAMGDTGRHDPRSFQKNRSIKALNQSREITKQINSLYAESKAVWSEEKQLRDTAWNLQRQEWKKQWRHKHKQKHRGLIMFVACALWERHRRERATVQIEEIKAEVVNRQAQRQAKKERIAQLRAAQVQQVVTKPQAVMPKASTTALNENKPSIPELTLIKLEDLNSKIKRLEGNFQRGVSEADYYEINMQTIVDELLELKKKVPGLSMKPSDAEPIKIDGKPITDYIQTKPQEKPQEKGIKI